MLARNIGLPINFQPRLCTMVRKNPSDLVCELHVAILSTISMSSLYKNFLNVEIQQSSLCLIWKGPWLKAVEDPNPHYAQAILKKVFAGTAVVYLEDKDWVSCLPPTGTG